MPIIKRPNSGQISGQIKVGKLIVTFVDRPLCSAYSMIRNGIQPFMYFIKHIQYPQSDSETQ
jgi:hypothetical protein